MLNHPSRSAKAGGHGNLRDAMEVLRPVVPVQRATPWRRPVRLGETAAGVLLLLAILAAACAFLLLLDRLGVPPAATTDFPRID